MISLRDLQHEIVERLFDDSSTAIPLPWISENGMSAQRRLQIYRNNVLIGFGRALEEMFPVVRRLAGAQWFAQTARAYQLRYPSRSGDLQHIGIHFAQYLEHQFAGSEYAYFCDVARLEWAYQSCLAQSAAESAGLTKLAALASEDAACVRLILDPTARGIHSIYPVLAIWNTHRAPSSAAAPMIELGGGPSHVLVIRRIDHVELRELSPEAFALLEALATGACLAEALESIATHHVADLSTALGRLISLGVFVGFEILRPDGQTHAD